MTHPSQIWIHTNAKKRKNSKVYILCDLQNHIRVMFDWYSLSSLHWGLKRKDIGVKWCLRTALDLCASNICIYFSARSYPLILTSHIIRRNESIFFIQALLCFTFFWAPTKEFITRPSFWFITCFKEFSSLLLFEFHHVFNCCKTPVHPHPPYKGILHQEWGCFLLRAIMVR